MGRIWQNVKNATKGLFSSSHYVTEDKQGYQHAHNGNTLGGTLTLSLLIPLLSYFIDSPQKNLNHPRAQTQNIQLSKINYEAPKTFFANSNPKLASIEISPIKIFDNKKIIYEDNLIKSKTIFKDSKNIRYTDQGIISPGKNYSVIYNGKEFLTNSDGFIVLPNSAVGKNVRLAKMNMQKANSKNLQEKYLASIKKTLSRDYPSDIQFVENKNEPKNSLENKVSANTQNSNRLNQNQLEETLSKLTPKIEYENPEIVFANYLQSNKPTEEQSVRVAKYLNQGHSFNDFSKYINPKRKRKDDSLFADINLLRNLNYDGKNLDTTIEEIKFSSSKPLSNQKVKEVFQEKYGVSINEKQISDSLKNNNKISLQEAQKKIKSGENQNRYILYEEYLRNKNYYNQLDTVYVIYNSHSKGKIINR